MDDDFEEHNNLMDDDPALDYILYKDMTEEQKGTPGQSGCFGVFVILLMPAAACSYLIAWL